MNLDTSIAALGLSEVEAAKRLAANGYNELPSDKPRSLIGSATKIVREPMLVMLLAAGALYLVLGDPDQALILLLSVFGVMGISLYQERKTERALAALRDLSSPRALVIRDGVARRIAGREVVNGDVVLVSEGDRIPADGALLSGTNVSVDESLLTGESAPVRKASAERIPQAMERPGERSAEFLYSGTLVVQGQGALRVVATGAATEIGRIGSALRSIEPESTRLQNETRQIVKKIAVAAMALCVLLAAAFGITRGDWPNAALAGLTLAMAILPEEFPVVLAVFFALGAWRIARDRVLTRRVAAIEMLGAASVLCVDKTGTLTKNRMTLAAVYGAGHAAADLAVEKLETLSPYLNEVLRIAVLASSPEPFDPMEKAILDAGRPLVRSHALKLSRMYPLSRELLAVTYAWKEPNGDHLIAAKGAPEAIAELCALDSSRRNAMGAEVGRMAQRGLRVLGVARAGFSGTLPSHPSGFDLEWLGLIGLADPIRENVPQAVRECRSAGMRVIMITGDSPETARNIAHQAGLDAKLVMTGRELDALDEDALRQRTADVFCRVVPEQKLRIVNALKANGEVVAMTGDGVNDAPALKAAHIGIAMGARGTDVAREAADIVLLDDDFSSIVRAVRLGRRIFDNLRKAFAFVVAVHVPTVGMSFLPLAFGWPLMLFPIHVVVLELIIDPACTIAFEAEEEEASVMKRAPRDSRENLLNPSTLVHSLLSGTIVLAPVFAIYAFMTMGGYGEESARTAAFTTLIIGNLMLIVATVSRSRPLQSMLLSRNTALWSVVLGAIALLAFALLAPPVRELFQFSPIELGQFFTASAAGLAVLFVLTLLQPRGSARTPA